MKKKLSGKAMSRFLEVKAVRYSIVVLSFLVSVALFPLPAAQADEPNVCISLSSGLPGAPVVLLDLFATYKASTVYGLNGTALSTQATNPPKEILYGVSGTAYLTKTSTVELSLTGTAEDPSCECMNELVIHVTSNGTSGTFTEVIRNSRDGSASILTGTAGISQGCGN
jgi:hypothetical protein